MEPNSEGEVPLYSLHVGDRFDLVLDLSTGKTRIHGQLVWIGSASTIVVVEQGRTTQFAAHNKKTGESKDVTIKRSAKREHWSLETMVVLTHEANASERERVRDGEEEAHGETETGSDEATE